MGEERDDSSVRREGCDVRVASMGCLLAEQAATRSDRGGTAWMGAYTENVYIGMRCALFPNQKRRDANLNEDLG